MIAHYATSGVTREREDGERGAKARGGFAGDGGESGGFTWFYCYAAEVDVTA
jgi:hypothetical protein